MCDECDDDEGLTITAITAGELPGYLDRLLGDDARAEGNRDDTLRALPEAPTAPAPQAADSWMDGVLALARQPVAGRVPARYVPPHPVKPVGRVPAQPAPPAHAVPERDRVWLDVSYDEKEAAKARGAIWDPVRKSWYAPRPSMAGLAAWARLPEVLPGEDRAFGQGLFVDLIPATSWFDNVRSAVSERDWYRIRHMVYRRAGQRCEACGAGADKAAGIFMEAHERFAYQIGVGAASGAQVLRRLICLCSRCHQVTHFGRTSLGRPQAEDSALAHLMAVTGMDVGQARAHVAEAFRVWDERSQREWAVDLGMLASAGIAAGELGEGGPAWAS